MGECITVDLGTPHEVTSIVIWNRTDVCRDRGRYLFYAVHNAAVHDCASGLPLTITHSFWDGSSGRSETVVPRISGRYVTLFSPEHTAVHLASLRVHGIPTG